MSCCFPEIFTIKSRRNFDVLGRQISGGRGRGHQNFLSNFINLVTVEHVAKFGDDRQATSEIRRRKKEEINDSGKTEWPVANVAGVRP